MTQSELLAMEPGTEFAAVVWNINYNNSRLQITGIEGWDFVTSGLWPDGLHKDQVIVLKLIKARPCTTCAGIPDHGQATVELVVGGNP